MANHLITFFFIPAKVIASVPMEETSDKQGIEEEKGIVVKDIVEEGELVKENEEKTKEMDVVEVKPDRSPDSRSPQSDAPSGSRLVFLSPFLKMICECHGVFKVFHFVFCEINLTRTFYRLGVSNIDIKIYLLKGFLISSIYIFSYSLLSYNLYAVHFAVLC